MFCPKDDISRSFIDRRLAVYLAMHLLPLLAATDFIRAVLYGFSFVRSDDRILLRARTSDWAWTDSNSAWRPEQNVYMKS